MQGFYLPKFQDIVRLKFWKSWTFLNFKAISLYWCEFHMPLIQVWLKFWKSWTFLNFRTMFLYWCEFHMPLIQIRSKFPVTKFDQQKPWHAHWFIKDLGLLPVQYQTITWTNGDLLTNEHIRTNLILIKIKNFSQKMHLRMFTMWQPFCSNLNELTECDVIVLNASCFNGLIMNYLTIRY